MINLIEANRRRSTEIRPIESNEFPENRDFLQTTISAAKVLEQAGLSPGDWFIISGGNVGLQQMARGINDRKPTDVDIVIRHQTPEHGTQILERIFETLNSGNVFINNKLIREPREHYGFKFNNPILESCSNHGCNFPVDFLTHMVTQFPESAFIPSLKGVSYVFPNTESILFDHTRPVMVDGQEIRLGNPAYVLFYKMCMNRNGLMNGGTGTPKQDDDDLLRMLQMKLVMPHDQEFRGILRVMFGNNPQLEAEFLKILTFKVREVVGKYNSKNA